MIKFALVGLVAGLSISAAWQHAPADPPCASVGYTVAGATNFGVPRPAWRELVFENRLATHTNAIAVDGQTLSLQPYALGVVRIRVHPGAELEIDASHSGTAIWGCTS